MIRLDKYLSDMGKGTRSEVTKLIKDGQVAVNSNVILKASHKIDEKTDTVFLNGEKVPYNKELYIMLNKPQGYVTATEDNYNKTVLDLIDDDYIRKRVSPAGRLDIDTEGFVFLTSDGQLNHKITGPKHHVRKRYFVKLKYPITKEDIIKLENGVELDDGYITKEAKVNFIDEYNIYLDIYEGKFHQVKRMLAAVSNKVIYLKRTMIGNLKLDESLMPGQYRILKEDEIELLCERI